MIEVRKLGLNGVLEIRPRRFADERGYLCETYNAKAFAEAGIDLAFVQDNHSWSVARGTMRGLHYQLPPFAQAKLVRIVRGSAYDVAVDIRRRSPTFGRWTGLHLSAQEGNQILLPAGFAHGIVTLEDDTEILYKMSAVYSAAHDRSIRFDDPAIGIDWPFDVTTARLSPKDSAAPLLAAAEVFEDWG